MNSGCTKPRIPKKTMSITLTFERLWCGFFGFGSSFLLHSDKCWPVCIYQTRRPMFRHQLWCIPWMWDQNWRDPACLKRPAHVTVFEENSALLEQAVRWCVSCPKYPPKSNEHTREWLSGHELSLLRWNSDYRAQFSLLFYVFIGWRCRRSSRTSHVF